MIDSKTVLETRVPGVGRDGGPACGAVKLLEEWKSAAAPRVPPPRAS